MQVRGLSFAGLFIASMACSGNAGGLVPPSPPPPSSPPPTGSARIEDLGLFHSSILNNDRGLHVYLPPGYDAGSQHYPVLYVHDGADAFGAPPGYMGYDQTASTLILAGTIRPLIIVAVDQVDRSGEFTPTVTSSGTGKGPLYARMLVEEIKPMIDAHYRTLTGPDDTGVGGKSLGGLISWYIALAHSGVFHRMFAESGTITYDNNWTVQQFQNLPVKLPVRIWFDRGTSDGEQVSHDADNLMRTALLAKGWVEGTDFRFLLAQGATHSEASFAARVDPILRLLFPNP
jgi:predicted alpha/beta superfamily hydrolase